MRITKAQYNKYIDSEIWKELRMHIAKQRNFTCERCGKVLLKGYHIHHLTYERFKHEKDEDLMFLCPECHDKIHNGNVLHRNEPEPQKKVNHKNVPRKRKKNKFPKTTKSLNYKCKYCGCKEFVVRKHITQTGLYCKECGRWYKMLNKKERSLI